MTGKVPVLAYKHELQALARDFRLNFHVGLMDEDEAREISPLVSVVSFDFVAEDETIREVYGVRRTAGDYLATYEMLRKHVRVIPHICIGLRGGKISGEYAAIDALSEIGAEAIVFLVLIPTRGTRYSGIDPPPVGEVVKVIQYAREAMSTSPIYIGCMRPRGEYRARLDQDAVELGVDRIVAPAREAVVLARERGLNITWREECCAFA
ncbi:MAG TPA: radical SAM protein [Firmicutes bacterium]|nr:radical SAM protein [Bacillota bacterium]